MCALSESVKKMDERLQKLEQRSQLDVGFGFQQGEVSRTRLSSSGRQEVQELLSEEDNLVQTRRRRREQMEAPQKEAEEARRDDAVWFSINLLSLYILLLVLLLLIYATDVRDSSLSLSA